MAGQVGFLSAVQSPEFTRTMQYRPDGKLEKLEFNIPTWKTLRLAYDYFFDGEIASEDVKALPLFNKPDSLQSKLQTKLQTKLQSKFLKKFKLYMILGRLSTVELNDRPVFSLNYDPFSHIEKVNLNDHSALHYQYDHLTERLLGFSSSAEQGQKSQNHWSFNQRGLIANESFGLDENHINRNYFYSPNGFLLSAADSGTGVNRKYSYDEVGLLKQFSKIIEKF